LVDGQADEHFEEKCHDICQTYRLAPKRAQAGVETVSIDEMTGIQALEHAAPILPMRAGKVQCQEFEHICHGVQTMIGGFHVATGRVIAHIGPPRNEEDIARNLEWLLGIRRSARGPEDRLPRRPWHQWEERYPQIHSNP